MTSADLLMTVPQYNLGDAPLSLTFDLQVSSKTFVKCPGTELRLLPHPKLFGAAASCKH